MEQRYVETIGGSPKIVSEHGDGFGKKPKSRDRCRRRRSQAAAGHRARDHRTDDCPRVIREDLYPREKRDAATVRRYAENLDVLPPIEVNQCNILIDGVHRYDAYRANKRETIPAIVTETANDAEVDRLAVIRNAPPRLAAQRQRQAEEGRRLVRRHNASRAYPQTQKTVRR